MENYIFEASNISKSFYGVYALQDAQIRIKKGEVHALVGENGAGKSTLMKIILGVHRPNNGEMVYKGEPYKPAQPRDALEKGISMIHQEISLAENMTVAENIWIGREPVAGGFVNFLELRSMARKLLEELKLDIDITKKVSSLSVAQKQMIEIARAISYNADLIIMDEPTSALTESETDKLFEIIRILKTKEVSVIIISHKLDELFEISDTVTVLRDGNFVGSYMIEDMTEQKLISLMVGRELTSLYPKEKSDIGDVVFKAEHITKKGLFEDVSFEIRSGEILGVSGLMGAGRSEIMLALFSGDKLDSGKIYMDGAEIVIHSPEDAIKNGLAMVPEDRKLMGLALCRSSKENMSITDLKFHSKSFFVNKFKEKEKIESMIQRISIKLSSPEQVVKSLSGGNQQKVVLSRWLLCNPKVLILDEPTRGIDVGSKSEIHRLISELACNGMAVIMISSEMPEILGMSDRIIVVRGGKINGEISRVNATQEKIMHMATS